MKKPRRRPAKSRFKRMKRPARLASGSKWLKSFKGKHALKSYRKRYGTDRITAAIELQVLGYSISEERITEIKQEVAAVVAARQRAREARTAGFQADQDETFAYIAGYTSGGAPYGVTWEEMEGESGAQGRE